MSDTDDSDTDDSDTTLPAAPATTEPRPGFPRWGVAFVAGLVLLVAGYLVLTTVHVGYFVQSPGSTVAIESRLQVDGAPSYPSDGEVHFTTVRLSSERATLLDVLGDWLDPASVLVEDERILQGRTTDQNRAFNQELMQDSQERAKRVALEYLGLDVIRADGALVSQVQPDTPADGVLGRGDVIVAVGGTEVMSSGELVDAIGRLEPGDELDLDVRRYEEPADNASGDTAPDATADAGAGDGAGTDADDQDEDAEPPTEVVSVTLAEHPDGDGSAFLGVAIVDDFELTPLPFDIDIDTRRVGGPSAGLALTLSIIDILTEGELTGGLQVATTGTIGVDGTVGPIGGIEQKAHAVRRAGIDVFLVPTADAEGAQKVLGDSVTVVGVDDLADAIEALGNLGGDVESLALPADFQPAA